MLTYFADTETIGFHGMPVLLQVAINRGPVILHHLWSMPIQKSLSIIRDMTENRVVAHNLRFDWFHLAKFFNTFSQAPDQSLTPLDYSIQQWVDWEWESQHGVCLRPHAAVDTLILAQKGKYQSILMDSKPIYVRRVPRVMAYEIRDELEAHTNLPGILFANSNDPSRWRIEERKDELTGELDPNWLDLKLVFNPSNGLKDLAKHILNYEPFARFDELTAIRRPGEIGYAPYTKLLSSAEENWLVKAGVDPDIDGKPTWPLLVQEHVDHWANDADAQHYAEDDITMLRNLYDHFGALENDEDSELAAQVAVCRLRGFAINLDKVQENLVKAEAVVASAQINVNSPLQVKGFVAGALDPMEQIIVLKGCDQKIIDEIKNEFTLAEQEECYCDKGRLIHGEECPRCEGVGTVGPGPMPVVKRVLHVEAIRGNIKKIQICKKLIIAKRLYASFKVIGAKSGRMSGADDFNPQGVDRSYDMRAMFTLADEGQILSGGDFSSQELSVMATAFHDEDLVRDMSEGKSLHGIFATCLDDTKTYEEVMQGKKDELPWAKKLYNVAKSFVYASSYGGTPEGIAKRLGIVPEVAIKAYNIMMGRYPQMGHTRRTITDQFSALKSGTSGSKKGKMTYSPVQTYVESMYGFRRDFSTEYEIQRQILDMIEYMPEEWRENDTKVIRDTKSSRVQTLAGAISSALYGAAFSVQNRVIRAALNHLIQSASRTITMGLHYRVWSVQPRGIHPFKLTLMSIHDELQVVSEEKMLEPIFEVAKEYVEEIEAQVPLISLEWAHGMASWAEKGASGVILGWSEEKALATT